MRYDLVEIYTRHWQRVLALVSQHNHHRDRAAVLACIDAARVCNHYQREMQR